MLYWKDTMFMCNDSPLSLFTGYDSVFREYNDCRIDYEGILKVSDKNYYAFWTIIDNMLYLYDVKYACARDSIEYKNFKRDSIETFLNAKFSRDILPKSAKKDEHFKNGVIPAVWFSDTLYIKRNLELREVRESDIEYLNEPFTCLIFKERRFVGEKIVSSMNKNKCTGK
jgi:hypothetical protein